MLFERILTAVNFVPVDPIYCEGQIKSRSLTRSFEKQGDHSAKWFALIIRISRTTVYELIQDPKNQKNQYHVKDPVDILKTQTGVEQD